MDFALQDTLLQIPGAFQVLILTGLAMRILPTSYNLDLMPKVGQTLSVLHDCTMLAGFGSVSQNGHDTLILQLQQALWFGMWTVFVILGDYCVVLWAGSLVAALMRQCTLACSCGTAAEY